MVDGEREPVQDGMLADRLQRGNVLAADCPSRLVLDHLTSRWGVLVLVMLQAGEMRFSSLRRGIGGVSERMLSQTLKQLEADGLVLRRSFDVVPPHVEYSLTPLGEGAAQQVRQMTDWIERNIGAILTHRAMSGG